MSANYNFADFYQLNNKNGRCQYIDNLIEDMSIDLWGKQGKICSYNKDCKYPVLEEKAYSIIAESFDRAIGNLREHICMAFLDYYYRDIINPGKNRQDLEEYFGWAYPDWENDLPQEVYFENNDERMIRPAFLSF